MGAHSGMQRSVLINHNSIRADVSLELQLGQGSPLVAQFIFLRPFATFYATRRFSLSHREMDYYGLDLGLAGTGDTHPFSATVGISYGRTKRDLAWSTGLGTGSDPGTSRIHGMRRNVFKVSWLRGSQKADPGRIRGFLRIPEGTPGLGQVPGAALRVGPSAVFSGSGAHGEQRGARSARRGDAEDAKKDTQNQ